MNNDAQRKYQAFKVLHDETVVMPNPWDVTARILTALGYKALANARAVERIADAKLVWAQIFMHDILIIGKLGVAALARSLHHGHQ